MISSTILCIVSLIVLSCLQPQCAHGRKLSNRVTDEDIKLEPQTTYAELSSSFDADIPLSQQIDIPSLARQEEARLVLTRRELHKVPELMFNEEKTSLIIRETLDSLNIDYTTGWGRNTKKDRIPGPGGYGVVARIGTKNGASPCVLLRADFDGLPILERTEGIDEFKSEHPNRMRKCPPPLPSLLALRAHA
jgi:hypothetical protein